MYCILELSMNSIIKINCAQCSQAFSITGDDQEFYTKLQVPPPTLCPDCRLQRRLTFRNERNLYKRNCDLCGRVMYALYKPGSPFPVYCGECWWSDKWDPLSYGREIDWDRPFFEQYQELLAVVPKSAVMQLSNENCEYNSFLGFSKNCYMCPGSYLTEDCYYVRKSQNCKDCVNSNILNKCELVANSTNCDTCYASHHLVNARSCSFSSYLMNCSGVQYGFMCCGVTNKKYCFKNKEYTPEEYTAIIERYAALPEADVLKEFNEFCKTVPRRSQIQLGSERSTGDYLFNCHNATECFDCFDIDTGKYLLECTDIKDSMDLNMHDKEIELCYELSSGGEKNYLTKFGHCTCASPESEYCYSCFYLTNGFGCDGIHARTQYVILNTKYSEQEYVQKRAQLIEHMKETKEYGEFFPSTLSPFAYNESAAQLYAPLSRDEALAHGFRWDDELESTQQQATDQALNCDTCAKQFRVITQEQSVYSKIGIAPPTICPDCRFAELGKWKNPRKLYQRTCKRCSAKITTTYAPNTPEQVYCEECYRAVIL